MKKILCISGSASLVGANRDLLEAIAEAFSDEFQFEVFSALIELPLFSPEKQKAGIPNEVNELKRKFNNVDAVIISTPEYLHNIPAVLKNALEWMTESGELADKAVLPITFTPAAPRGKNAMTSLVQSLLASKAKVIVELPLYQNELRNESGKMELSEGNRFILKEALNLL